ncbi:hypothetical protein HYFRA_00010253 [Hymenoscyphus fraxineus]|uniref:Uncharacterized protein n=1 Tax=Hymenoscyphus fraxineus TaxID=746836 RepID=A0A9N9KVR0_9HELO|nr:hypothetical protein HYFRA_00010253 [Hymenoscyphus fraxineus]
MRSTVLTTSLSLFTSLSALQVPSILQSFYEAQTLTNDTAEPHELLKRDGNCAPNYNSCSTLAANFGGACCIQGSTCTLDRARNVACCPIGAVCTGTVILGSAAPTGIIIGGGATTGPAPNTPTTTAPNNPNSATITAAPSVVPNAFFPFPIIPTTYPNSVLCASAYTACSQNFAACTANLGGAFGVTVVAPQGGVTVAPTAVNLGVASANSVCSSLSQAACLNLRPSDCDRFGAAGGGSFVIGG